MIHVICGAWGGGGGGGGHALGTQQYDSLYVLMSLKKWSLQLVLSCIMYVSAISTSVVYVHKWITDNFSVDTC